MLTPLPEHSGTVLPQYSSDFPPPTKTSDRFRPLVLYEIGGGLFAGLELIDIVFEFRIAAEHTVHVGIDRLIVLLLILAVVEREFLGVPAHDLIDIDTVVALHYVHLLVGLRAGDDTCHLGIVDTRLRAEAECGEIARTHFHGLGGRCDALHVLAILGEKFLTKKPRDFKTSEALG